MLLQLFKRRSEKIGMKAFTHRCNASYIFLYKIFSFLHFNFGCTQNYRTNLIWIYIEFAMLNITTLAAFLKVPEWLLDHFLWVTTAYSAPDEVMKKVFVRMSVRFLTEGFPHTFTALIWAMPGTQGKFGWDRIMNSCQSSTVRED